MKPRQLRLVLVRPDLTVRAPRHDDHGVPRRLLELEGLVRRARAGEEPDAIAAVADLCLRWRHELDAQLAEIDV